MQKARNTMKQALGRLYRGTHDVYLFILSGLDLKLDFPVKEIYSQQVMINNKLKWKSAHNNLIKITNELRKERNEETEIRKLINFIKNNNNKITVKEYSLLIDKSEVTAKNRLMEFVDKEILNYKTKERDLYVFFIKDKLKEKLEKYIEEFVKPFIR